MSEEQSVVIVQVIEDIPDHDLRRPSGSVKRQSCAEKSLTPKEPIRIYMAIVT